MKSKTSSSTSRTARASKAAPAGQRQPARRRAAAALEAAPDATPDARTALETVAAADPAVAAEPVAPAQAAAAGAEAGRFGREAVDALMSSSAALARGLQEMQQVWLGFAQASLQDGAAVARAMATARTPRELFQLQSDYARATVDKLMAESGRASQLSLNAANEAMRPLQHQVGSAISRLWRRQAA
ncbi:MAG: phasin family protein [Dongiaceae bacterium]